MFNKTLQKIIKRQNYIDQLSDEQISTIQTKQLFFKALQESPNIDPFGQNDQLQQKLFRTATIDGPATNLLKHIIPAPQNSYQQIEQMENRIKMFNEKKLNQVETVKSIFESEKYSIMNSGLKVSDFLDLYESDDISSQQKDINDPLVKKIMAYFQTNTKQHSLYELLNLIVQGISEPQVRAQQQLPQAKSIRKIRQSVCSLQGFNIVLEDQQSKFNQETRKQMDNVISYYQDILQLFDIQSQQ